MTPYEFTLEVPADATYRTLAPEVGRRFAEILGASKAERDQFAASIVETMMTVAAGSQGRVHLAFRNGVSGVEVTVRCGERSSVVRRELHAGTS